MENSKFYFYCLSIFIFGMMACKKGQVVIENTVTELLELKYQESAEVPSINKRIQLTKIDDTRCPSDVLCVHGGWVTVEISVNSIFSNITLIRQIELDLESRDTVDNLIYSLLEVSPYPHYENPVPIEEKQIKLQIESF